MRAGAEPGAAVRAVVRAYMGEGFPVESIEWDILERIADFAHLGPEPGLAAYLTAVGREGRVVLAAIRRNFTRRPDLWRQAVS